MLKVREIQAADVELVCDYWSNSSPEHLLGMGADPAKFPARADMHQNISKQLTQDYPDKAAYCLIWLQDERPIGHTNINQIQFGKQAYMHLHLWHSATRQKGMGQQLVRLSLPYYFKHFQLQTLFCEPYALNPAPNKTVAKVGFRFVKTHRTIPGSLNFEQEANLWAMDRAEWERLSQH